MPTVALPSLITNAADRELVRVALHEMLREAQAAKETAETRQDMAKAQVWIDTLLDVYRPLLGAKS